MCVEKQTCRVWYREEKRQKESGGGARGRERERKKGEPFAVKSIRSFVTT